LNKKRALLFIFVLLLFAGIIALTQESGEEIPAVKIENEFVESESRWFRSNAGGMALEEIPSRVAALRHEYALVIEFAQKEELPEDLYLFYNEEYIIEVRALYEKERQIKTQWIFREAGGKTRLVAVFTETDAAGKEEQNKSSVSGFIEVYDEKALLSAEYRFLKDGGRSRTDYIFKDGLLISSEVLLWEENDEGEPQGLSGRYVKAYTDYFRYNRSFFLRSIQRIFYKDSEISSLEDPVVIAFPYEIMTSARERAFTERYNSYPEFFGNVFAVKDTKIYYSIDERGRILSQTLFDKDGIIIWVIYNTWKDDRIVSTVKEEGSNLYLAEYEYNSGGDRTLERNYTNGILERVVRSQGKTDTEELYLNGNVILKAVWEDGRKVSETRTGN